MGHYDSDAAGRTEVRKLISFLFRETKAGIQTENISRKHSKRPRKIQQEKHQGNKTIKI